MCSDSTLVLKCLVLVVTAGCCKLWLGSFLCVLGQLICIFFVCLFVCLLVAMHVYLSLPRSYHLNFPPLPSPPLPSHSSLPSFASSTPAVTCSRAGGSLRPSSLPSSTSSKDWPTARQPPTVATPSSVPRVHGGSVPLRGKSPEELCLGTTSSSP